MRRVIKPMLTALCCSMLIFGSILLIVAGQQDNVTVYAAEDGVTDFVSRLYTEILGREADEGGLATWTDALLSGECTGTEVAKGFIMSEEFLGKDMTNEEFVQILYRAFFGREADENGLATWVDFLDQGYRKSYIFAGFANSSEFGSLCGNYEVEAGSVPVTISEQQPGLSEEEYNVWLFVERLYTEVLGRTPDMGGIKEWADYLLAGTYSGAEVAEGFIMSAEFTGKDISNEEYVEIMYKTFFGREADENGLATWVNALEENSRKYVFAGFANSAEFGTLCNSFNIERGTVAALSEVPAIQYCTGIVGGVIVTWKPVAGATQYGIWRSETGEEDSYECLTVMPTTYYYSYTDNTVVDSTIYYYKVSAIDPGTGTHGELSEAFQIIYLTPVNVESLVSESTSITCSWTAVPSVRNYTVSVYVIDNNNYIYDKSYSAEDSTSYTVTDLQPATDYAIAISYRKEVEGCMGYSGGDLIKVSTLNEDGNPEGLYEWTENEDGTVTITKYKNLVSKVVVPEELGGKKVSGIAQHTFGYENKTLTEVELPDTLTTIGEYAFYGCSGLTEINLPDGLTAIGSGAFSKCTGLTEINLPNGLTAIGNFAFSDCTGLTEINLPNGLTTIGSGAFSDCTGLTEIHLPDGVTIIENTVFHGCTSLREIELPEGLEEIGNNAFFNCTSLQTIELPKNLQRMDTYTFFGCDNLVSITVDDENQTYASKDGWLFSKNMEELILVPYAYEGVAVIPDTVVSLGAAVFQNCRNITEIVLPEALGFYQINNFGCEKLEKYTGVGRSYEVIDGVLYTMSYENRLISYPNAKIGEEYTVLEGINIIGYEAFVQNAFLKSVRLPESLTRISSRAFYQCNNLESVSIAEGIESIEDNVFWECAALARVELPASVTYLGNLFDDCALFGNDAVGTIIAPAGSYAEQWAIEKGYRVENPN